MIQISSESKDISRCLMITTADSLIFLSRELSSGFDRITYFDGHTIFNLKTSSVVSASTEVYELSAEGVLFRLTPS